MVLGDSAGCRACTVRDRFDLPGQTVGATDFGWVTSAGACRIMQFGLKLYW